MSTISNNQSELGGGIRNTGYLTVTNTTISDNSATNFGGGGVYNCCGGLTSVASSSIIGNSSTGEKDGGGIQSDAPVKLVNSIVGNNFGGGDCSDLLDYFDAVDSGGHNIASDSTCELDKPGDLNDTDPLVGPLQDNGGPTLTHALSPVSPAVDAGDPARCPASDQRGISRLFDGDADGSPACDIGAYEYDGPPPERVYLPLTIKN